MSTLPLTFNSLIGSSAKLSTARNENKRTQCGSLYAGVFTSLPSSSSAPDVPNSCHPPCTVESHISDSSLKPASIYFSKKNFIFENEVPVTQITLATASLPSLYSMQRYCVNVAAAATTPPPIPVHMIPVAAWEYLRKISRRYLKLSRGEANKSNDHSTHSPPLNTLWNLSQTPRPSRKWHFHHPICIEHPVLVIRHWDNLAHPTFPQPSAPRQ